jgi:uncharacterized protein
MTTRRRSWLPALGILCALGCTSQTTEAPTPQAREPATQQQAPPSPTRSPSTSASPQRPVEPVSLPAMMQRTYDGHALRTRDVILRTDAYTRYYVTYRSDGLRISGIMNVPDGNGPFPVLVLNHGYIDPADYVNGQGLSREQDFLARAGYVALHTTRARRVRRRPNAGCGSATPPTSSTPSARSAGRICRTSTRTA